ncbi:UDP-N-acetylmuramate--L-alanine ligase [Candidatus Uhrbacteria bacterium]|nr:UDP-N-acetylmuramate--L-alanine ligase [Candidatus Uhrbacteria bacterium]
MDGMTVNEAQKIHCVGIGGIGVSALAQLWRAQGKEVSGFDAEESEITRALEKQGIEIYRGSTSGIRIPEVEPPNIVVYSDAVPEDHPERVAAREAGVPEMSYAQALGEVSRDYKTIVVTGTHGKSTTTALLGLMLEAADLDPLVIVGSKVPGWTYGNLRIGKGKYFVVEGDDYRDHFLELAPYAVVVTNIEWDHPDYFRDLEHTVKSFAKLVEKVPQSGLAVINGDDPCCRSLSEQKTHPYKLENVRMLLYGRDSEVFAKLELQVPGEFNRYNATAAATAAMELGVSREVVEKLAREFKGVWRRFEVVGKLETGNWKLDGSAQISNFKFPVLDLPIIISDYGHHPTAIRETMKAARESFPGRRLVLVFQPHQHSRTKRLFNDFVEALRGAADIVIVSDIYAVKGRMEDHNVSSRDIVEAIKRLSDGAIKFNNLITQSSNNSILYGGDLAQTKRVVLEQIKPGDVVIFMGAGDIDNLARAIIQEEK